MAHDIFCRRWGTDELGLCLILSVLHAVAAHRTIFIRMQNDTMA